MGIRQSGRVVALPIQGKAHRAGQWRARIAARACDSVVLTRAPAIPARSARTGDPARVGIDRRDDRQFLAAHHDLVALSAYGRDTAPSDVRQHDDLAVALHDRAHHFMRLVALSRARGGPSVRHAAARAAAPLVAADHRRLRRRKQARAAWPPGHLLASCNEDPAAMARASSCTLGGKLAGILADRSDPVFGAKITPGTSSALSEESPPASRPEARHELDAGRPRCRPASVASSPSSIGRL
jgi:hypothetical protein